MIETEDRIKAYQRLTTQMFRNMALSSDATGVIRLADGVINEILSALGVLRRHGAFNDLFPVI